MVASPVAVTEVHNLGVFIACSHGNGLRQVDDEGNLTEIKDGSFSDVCAYRNKAYALEYEKRVIMEISKMPIGDTSRELSMICREIQLSHTSPLNCGDTLMVDSLEFSPQMGGITVQFYVFNSFNCTLYMYTDCGRVIYLKRFGFNGNIAGMNLNRNLLISSPDNQVCFELLQYFAIFLVYYYY